MRTYALALGLVLTACGGGSTPESRPSATASSAAPVTPEAQKIRDAVAKTVEACPCRVHVRASAYALGAPTELTGVYDAASHSGTFHVEDENGELEVRVVDGGVWLTTEAKAGARARWLRLDFSSMPTKPRSSFAVFAVADPGMSLAMAAGTTTASVKQELRKGTTLYDVTMNVADAVAAAGPRTDLLKRLVHGVSVYDSVQVDAKGRIVLATFSTNVPGATGGDETLSATVRFEAFGVKGGATKAPTGPSRTVDAATFTG